MARKTVLIPITAPGRDAGKWFHIREMSASHAEEWALRCFNAVARSGVDIEDSIRSAGMAGVALIGLVGLAKMHWHDAKPLLDEMFACIQIAPDPTNRDVLRALIEDDIEEVATRFKLRAEVFTLHTDFSFADVLLILDPTEGTSAPEPGTAQTTSTSQEASGPSSPPA